MKKLFTTSVIILSLTLVACGGNGGNGGAKAAPATTKADCESGDPVETLEGQYHTNMGSDDVGSYSMNLSIGRQSFAIEMVCKYKNFTLSAEAATQYQSYENKIELLGHAQDVSYEEEGDMAYECTAGLEPMVYGYELNGSCVVITDTRSSEIMYFKKQ